MHARKRLAAPIQAVLDLAHPAYLVGLHHRTQRGKVLVRCSAMARLNLPEPFAKVDDLIEHGDMTGARVALAKETGNPALKELLEVKMGLYEGALAPQLAMNRLLNLMRQDAKLPGA